MFMVYMFDAIMVHLDNCRIFLHIVLIFQKKNRKLVPQQAVKIKTSSSQKILIV